MDKTYYLWSGRLGYSLICKNSQILIQKYTVILQHTATTFCLLFTVSTTSFCPTDFTRIIYNITYWSQEKQCNIEIMPPVKSLWQKLSLDNSPYFTINSTWHHTNSNMNYSQFFATFIVAISSALIWKTLNIANVFYCIMNSILFHTAE